MHVYQKPTTGVRTTQLQTFKEELKRSGFVEKIEPRVDRGANAVLGIVDQTDVKTFRREVRDQKLDKVLWHAEVRLYEKTGINAQNDQVTEMVIWARSNLYGAVPTLAIAFPNKCPGIIDPEKIAWPTNIIQVKEAKNYRDAPEFETVNIVTIEGMNNAIYQVQRAEVIAVQIGVATKEELDAYFETRAKVTDIEKLQKIWRDTGTRDERTRDFAIGLLEKTIFKMQEVQERVLEIARKLAENQELRTLMDQFVQDRSQSE